MASPARSPRRGTSPLSPRRQTQLPRDTRGSAARRSDKPRASSDAARLKNLSKSVTEFFSKLRPSKRPERGGTARQTTYDGLELHPAEPRSPRPTASCRTKRSGSLDRHGPDTIPARLWNMPITPPRRAHSVGARGRKPVATQPRLNANANPHRNSTPTSNKNRLPPRPQPHHRPHHNPHHNPLPHPHPPSTRSHFTTAALPPSRDPRPSTTIPPPPTQRQASIPASIPASITTPLPTPLPTPTPQLTPQQQTQTHHNPALYRTQRALRQQRQTLISSGDFLGVTGVNPYTGEPDVITPPTSSDDAVVTSSSSQAAGTSSALLMPATGGVGRGRQQVGRGDGDAGVVYDLRIGGAEGKAGRRMQREEERLHRAEQRKDAVREVLLQRGVKWRREEGGWSSVAEPKLSPILQSPQGSGKSSVHGEAGFGGGSYGKRGNGFVRPQESFLGMAAVAGGVDGCRRRYGDAGGEMGVVLPRWEQAGQMRVGTGKGWCPLRKVMVRFCLPPLVPRRQRFIQQSPGRLVEYQPEWELGSLVAIPVDLRRLSEDCRVQRMSTGRVLELDDLESCASSQLHDLDSPHSQTDVIMKARSREIVHGQGQALQCVCTRTTTTTGFGRGRPRRRIAALPFGAMLDGSHDAPPRQAALMPRARSRSTSRPSSTTTPRNTCSDRPASPGRMQLSVWRNLSSRGLPMTTLTSVRKKVGIDPLGASRTPRPPLEQEADSDTMSSSTDHETTAPAQEKVSAKPRQPTAGNENRPPQQRDWAMRKTMRRPPSSPSPSGPEEETGARRSSLTSTRTSTSPAARRRSLRTTARPDQAETIARGAARTAFAHHGSLPGIMARVPMGESVRPVSARDPGSHHPHGAGAAGTRAKTAAKPGVAAETGREQGGKKGKGKGQDHGKGEQKGKEKGKGEQKGTEKGKATKGDPGSLEVRHWLRNTVVMLARVVGAYWQVVSPVFDGDSELRKRVDRAQATRGDVVVCVLAVVFLFLVVSGGVWAVRGIVWMVRLLGELGEVLRAVAGLRD